MIPAKNLLPETEAKTEQSEQTEQVQLNEPGKNKIQSVVKLLIMMLLTYAIIFM